MSEPSLYFIPLVSASAFREAAEILDWKPTAIDAHQLPVCWTCEGLEVRISWKTWPGQPIPLLQLEGTDAESLARDLQLAVPLVDAEDAMRTIGEASTEEQLATWAERLALFARGPHDDSVAAVLAGLLNSGNVAFQHAVLLGLQTSDWPQMGPKIGKLRLDGRIPSTLNELALSVESHLSKQGN